MSGLYFNPLEVEKQENIVSDVNSDAKETSQSQLSTTFAGKEIQFIKVTAYREGDNSLHATDPEMMTHNNNVVLYGNWHILKHYQNDKMK